MSASARKMKSSGGRKSPRDLPVASAPFLLSSDTRKTPQFSRCFDGVAQLLHGRKNIVVLVGAGISVSCGIPDFRSRDSGLYSTLDVDGLGLSCPEDLFDWEFFQEDPAPFYNFARNLYFPLGVDKKVEPSDSHKLLAMLEQKKMLLRVYSQNIDGLENMAGVSSKKMCYVHGSLQWATCCNCQRKVSAEEILPAIKGGSVARCMAAKKSTKVSSSPREPMQRATKRQRPSDDVCGGVFKPAITFFGETLNGSVSRSLEADRDKADALIVIGTSLSVAPISKVIEYMPPNIPRILINRTIVHPSTSPKDGDPNSCDDSETDFRRDYVWDACLLGFAEDVTRALARQLFNVPEAVKNPRSRRKKGAQHAYGGRMLTTVLDGDDEEYSSDEWSVVTVPPERVLLFHGALASKNDATDVTYREIAHCDGCSKQIRGVIQKCMACFDYDLCQECFPSLSKSHYGGKHSFSRESSAA